MAAALELRGAALRLALPAALELRSAALDLASQVVDGEAGRTEPSGGLGETGRRRETGGRRQSRDRENAERSGLVRQISWDGADPHLHQIFPSWVCSNPCYLHPNAPKRGPTHPGWTPSSNQTDGYRRTDRRSSAHVLFDLYTTTKYTEKQDVELLSSGRPELG